MASPCRPYAYHIPENLTIHILVTEVTGLACCVLQGLAAELCTASLHIKGRVPIPYPTRISLPNLAQRFQNCLCTDINCISDPKAGGEDFLSDTLISEHAPSEQTTLTNTAWIVNTRWTYLGEPNNPTRLSTDLVRWMRSLSALLQSLLSGVVCRSTYSDDKLRIINSFAVCLCAPRCFQTLHLKNWKNSFSGVMTKNFSTGTVHSTILFACGFLVVKGSTI